VKTISDKELSNLIAIDVKNLYRTLSFSFTRTIPERRGGFRFKADSFGDFAYLIKKHNPRLTHNGYARGTIRTSIGQANRGNQTQIANLKKYVSLNKT
jgi:hypothetical protein